MLKTGEGSANHVAIPDFCGRIEGDWNLYIVVEPLLSSRILGTDPWNQRRVGNHGGCEHPPTQRRGPEGSGKPRWRYAAAPLDRGVEAVRAPNV